jgi:hypothetical protein
MAWVSEGCIEVDSATEPALVKLGIIEKSVTHWICLSGVFRRTQETTPSDNFQVI